MAAPAVTCYSFVREEGSNLLSHTGSRLFLPLLLLCNLSGRCLTFLTDSGLECQVWAGVGPIPQQALRWWTRPFMSCRTSFNRVSYIELAKMSVFYFKSECQGCLHFDKCWHLPMHHAFANKASDCNAAHATSVTANEGRRQNFWQTTERPVCLIRYLVEPKIANLTFQNNLLPLIQKSTFWGLAAGQISVRERAVQYVERYTMHSRQSLPHQHAVTWRPRRDRLLVSSRKLMILAPRRVMLMVATMSPVPPVASGTRRVVPAWRGRPDWSSNFWNHSLIST